METAVDLVVRAPQPEDTGSAGILVDLGVDGRRHVQEVNAAVVAAEETVDVLPHTLNHGLGADA